MSRYGFPGSSSSPDGEQGFFAGAAAPTLGQPLEISLEDAVGLHAVLEALELEMQFAGTRLGQAINHPLPPALPDGQTMRPQIGQVLRDGNLREIEQLLKMTDAQRSLEEQVQDSQTVLVAKAAVDLNEFQAATSMSEFKYASSGIFILNRPGLADRFAAAGDGWVAAMLRAPSMAETPDATFRVNSRIRHLAETKPEPAPS